MSKTTKFQYFALAALLLILLSSYYYSCNEGMENKKDKKCVKGTYLNDCACPNNYKYHKKDNICKQAGSDVTMPAKPI